ncbi:MAG TPA: hypothetical protein VH854_15220 [Thermoanaerobaculia bacterium]|jgi:hypothetical protein|nr:hypothetical protein [Thermoanaerobaculia bacterium]
MTTPRRAPASLAALLRGGAPLAVLCAGSAILAWSCSGAPPAEPRMAAPAGGSRAPYDTAPVNPGPVTVNLDLRPARELLALLAKSQFDANDAHAIEILPVVQSEIRESGRGRDVYEHDLAAAFDAQARITVFDFRRIREDRTKWEALLSQISSREGELTRRVSDRARALIPATPAVPVTVPVAMTFGLAGRTDQIVVATSEGGERTLVIDLERALADLQSSGPNEQIQHLSRMMATEAYARAWAHYRSESPVWSRHDASLGQLEPLVRAVAERGPVSLYGVDENFFPLSVWLKEPMRTSLDDLNRVADKLVSTEGDLDARVSLQSEIRRPDFAVRVAGPAGAFLADGIISAVGVDGYRAALAAGPTAFFEAYDKASQEKGHALIPLSKAIRDRLAAAAAPAGKPPAAQKHNALVPAAATAAAAKAS